MKTVVARYRCELDGKVYLPGDQFEVNDMQYRSLMDMAAIDDVPLEPAPQADAPKSK